MLYVKILCVVALVLCIVPVVSAGNETWFDATCEDQFDDFENGLKQALFAIVGIFVITCAIMTLVGHFAHKLSWFKYGISGFGVLIFVAIAYGLGLGIFYYYTGTYW